MQRVLCNAAAACALATAIPALACTGSVVIGEGADAIGTSVPNKEIGGRCFNELIVDTVGEGAAWDNPGQFVSALAALTSAWQKAGAISGAQKGAIMDAASRSKVGTTLTVRVIGFNDFH